jgi:CBS domain-containing membrane protein
VTHVARRERDDPRRRRRVRELLESRRIRHLPVVREDGTLVGIVTHRELDRGARLGLDEAPVTACMVTAVRTVTRHTPLKDAVDLMLGECIAALPVVDPHQRLIGIITASDILRFSTHVIDDLDRRDLAARFNADA